MDGGLPFLDYVRLVSVNSYIQKTTDLGRVYKMGGAQC